MQENALVLPAALLFAEPENTSQNRVRDASQLVFATTGQWAWKATDFLVEIQQSRREDLLAWPIDGGLAGFDDN